MKIGIMGGTFDPIHNGHLIVAEYARERAELDEIWFMPTYQPPHKSDDPAADAADRAAMVAAAIADAPKLHVCTLELELGGTSYTFDTVTALQKKYPDHQFQWIIGADMIAYLPKWHRIDELVRLITFVGLERPGYEEPLAELPPFLREAIHMVQAPLIDLSSTEIRRRIREGLSVRYMLPDAVIHYMEENRIYGS